MYANLRIHSECLIDLLAAAYSRIHKHIIITQGRNHIIGKILIDFHKREINRSTMDHIIDQAAIESA